MVKREDIKPGVVVKVVKAMPGNGKPGPSFDGKLGLNEKLELMGTPTSSGGLNLVKVKRTKTGAVTELMYAFITNFCKVVKQEPATAP